MKVCEKLQKCMEAIGYKLKKKLAETDLMAK